MEQDNFGSWNRLSSGAVTKLDLTAELIKSAKIQELNSRIKALKKFLKEKNLDPEKLSDEQLILLQEIFHYLTGDDVIEAYKSMTLKMKKGGSIYIKKLNRGKFTEYCDGKVTQECIDRGKNSPDPKIRKLATFAKNARSWKHLNGGKINYINIFK